MRRSPHGMFARLGVLLAVVLAAPLSCGGNQASSSPGSGGGTGTGSGGAGAQSGDASAAGSTTAGSAGTNNGGIISLPRPCESEDRPGEPCAGGRCYGTRCGIRADLECVGERWQARTPYDAGASTAWDFVCPAEDESVSAISEITWGQCCGEPGQGAELPASQGCGHCPDLPPADLEACSLPASCSPMLVDCFYSCCCYGTRTWAQCDGERWHVTTECSSK